MMKDFVLKTSCTDTVANMIESFALTSDIPVFRTAKFRKALRDFRIHGIKTQNIVKFDLEYELSFIEKKLKNKFMLNETELLLL